jgi:uncharacterized protein
MDGVCEVTEEKIAKAVALLAQGAAPSRILVFGSAARGALGPHSDLDLLVIMKDEVGHARSESVRLRRFLNDLEMSVDILVISEREAAEAITRKQGILSRALREGQVRYEAGE